ncbi:hypothetical protein X777_05617, partial [Ooceraea biroi]
PVLLESRRRPRSNLLLELRPKERLQERNAQFQLPVLYSVLSAPGTQDLVKYSAAARTESQPYPLIHLFEMRDTTNA